MATTKIWAIKEDLSYSIDYISNREKTLLLKSVIDYAENKEKTIMNTLCTGINCDEETAYEDMKRIKCQFGKKGGILGHHAVQNFLPGEITASRAHEIGVELAKEMWGSRFQVVVATHIDKAHIHNHFIINSVSFIDGKKYNSCKATYRKLRLLSDEYCKNSGLSIVNLPRNEGKSMETIYAQKTNSFNLREYIANDIDIAISKSISMNEFYNNLRNMGYSIKFGKHVAVKPAGKDGYIRLRTIKDENYLPEGIRRRIAKNYAQNYGLPITTIKSKKIICNKPKIKMTGYKALYYRYLFLLGKIPNKRYPKRIPYRIAKESKNLNKIIFEISIIEKYHLKDSNDLIYLKKFLSSQINQLSIERDFSRRIIRRVVPIDEKEKARNQITKITEEMRNIRKELKACEGIEIRTTKSKSIKVNKEKEVSLEGVKTNEYGRRNSRLTR